MLPHDKIAAVAQDVLRDTLGPFGFQHADVEDDTDQDGEPALRVVAHFRAGSRAADGKSALAALTKLREALRNQGDERFPFLRYDYPDDDVPAATIEDFDP